MGDMLIRGIPGPLKGDIARAARKEGTSLSAKAIDLLRKGLVLEREAQPDESASAWDQLRSAFVLHDALGDEYAGTLDEIEAERKRDFGRPPPEFE